MYVAYMAIYSTCVGVCVAYLCLGVAKAFGAG